ncbi:hypothetical protein TNCV_3660711 [Trichonephila clavipes]|nr:hypothetical protein TNCV_3660711 [Trichonephila clavipes]
MKIAGTLTGLPVHHTATEIWPQPVFPYAVSSSIRPGEGALLPFVTLPLWFLGIVLHTARRGRSITIRYTPPLVPRYRPPYGQGEGALLPFVTLLLWFLGIVLHTARRGRSITIRYTPPLVLRYRPPYGQERALYYHSLHSPLVPRYRPPYGQERALYYHSLQVL